MALNENTINDTPVIYQQLVAKGEEIGFDMPSDMLVGSLLKTLISSKPGCNVLELGTGIGLSLSWMVAGMDENSTLTTIDNDQNLVDIAESFFGKDERVSILCEDGSTWLKNYKGAPFDLIFADAWPGKYSELDEVLKLLQKGSFYVIDDMNAQPNWPKGHENHVDQLIQDLEKRDDLTFTKLNWSTGIVIVVKK